MKFVGPEAIRNILPDIDSQTFSAELFDRAGMFVVREAVPAPVIAQWQAAWRVFQADKLAQREIYRFNPVQINETLPPALNELPRDSHLLDIVEQAFGPNIALFNHRFVVKDQFSRKEVFLHHDYCYHTGWPRKASAFVPLSQVTRENGAMVFYPGTHQFGYLGDTGEIDPDIIAKDWPTVIPDLKPGDIVLMNSMTWHSSLPHTGGPDRILADIIYQPASDPSSIALLRGKWETEIFLRREAGKEFFKNSRSQALRKFEARIAELEAEKAKVS